MQVLKPVMSCHPIYTPLMPLFLFIRSGYPLVTSSSTTVASDTVMPSKGFVLKHFLETKHLINTKSMVQ